MADITLSRLNIRLPAIRKELQSGGGRRFANTLGRQLVAKIKGLFPRSRQPSPGRKHAADTITYTTQPTSDGLQISVHTVNSPHAIFVEKGSSPARIVATRTGRTRQGRNKRGQFTRRRPVLVIEKASGEVHFRGIARTKGQRGKEPFRRGAESLGLKVRRR